FPPVACCAARPKERSAPSPSGVAVRRTRFATALHIEVIDPSRLKDTPLVIGRVFGGRSSLRILMSSARSDSKNTACRSTLSRYGRFSTAAGAGNGVGGASGQCLQPGNIGWPALLRADRQPENPIPVF